MCDVRVGVSAIGGKPEDDDDEADEVGVGVALDDAVVLGRNADMGKAAKAARSAGELEIMGALAAIGRSNREGALGAFAAAAKASTCPEVSGWLLCDLPGIALLLRVIESKLLLRPLPIVMPW